MAKRLTVALLLVTALLVLAPCDGRMLKQQSSGERKAEVTQLLPPVSVLPPVPSLPVPRVPVPGGLVPGVPGGLVPGLPGGLVPGVPPARMSIHSP